MRIINVASGTTIACPKNKEANAILASAPARNPINDIINNGRYLKSSKSFVRMNCTHSISLSIPLEYFSSMS
jgi:hypothetical protein